VPLDTLEHILKLLPSRDLATMDATCRHFITSGMTEKIARRRMTKTLNLVPCYAKHETSLTLLEYLDARRFAIEQRGALALGGYHTVVLMKGRDDVDYCAYAFGDGHFGQTGIYIHHTYRPVRAPPLHHPKNPIPMTVHAGHAHSALVTDDDDVFTWGCDDSGQLGLGLEEHTVGTSTPTHIDMGQQRMGVVACGSDHTLAISHSEDIYSCGSGRRGQLGHGVLDEYGRGAFGKITYFQGIRILAVAAGKAHSVALTEDNGVFTWGDARRGQLGHAHLSDQAHAPDFIATPERVELSLPLIEGTDGEDKTRGKGTTWTPKMKEFPDTVVQIAAGGNHTMLTTASGEVWAFGCNHRGQLGVGDTTDRFVPERVRIEDTLPERRVRAMIAECGAAHSAVLVHAAGQTHLMTTGSNEYGQLGLGDRTYRTTLHPVAFPPSVRVTCVKAGEWHNAAVTEADDLYTWGRGNFGQLGHRDDRDRRKPLHVTGFKVARYSIAPYELDEDGFYKNSSDDDDDDDMIVT
jgi:alpha-tubulin suppressor-like RCC1 family protein